MAKDERGKEQERKKVNSLIDNLTLFDDDLMSRVFDRNIEATELVLKIILGRDIKVVSVKGQDEMKNHEVGGRNIRLDVHAVDEDGEEMDIEVQGSPEGAHIRRARYYSSMVDSRMLRENQSFKELKDSYIIFIYRHDKFGKGLPLYHVNRYIKETDELFDDGSHIVYVNGNYKGNDEIGKLIEDFHQARWENMHYKALAKSVKHYKEKEGGRDNMCEAVENYAKEYAREYAAEEKIISVKNLMKNMKLTLEQALDALGIDDDERERIVNRIQNESAVSIYRQ